MKGSVEPALERLVEGTVMFHVLQPDRDDGVSRALLGMSIGDPTAERVARAQLQYEQETDWQLLGYAPAGSLLGSIGFQITAPDETTIRHIAVLPPYRGQGIGRKLVEHLIATRRLERLLAETDRDAVGFYRRCGLVITSLGERYPGVERFGCAWARVP